MESHSGEFQMKFLIRHILFFLEWDLSPMSHVTHIKIQCDFWATLQQYLSQLIAGRRGEWDSLCENLK